MQEDKTALVTGASRGIGLATAKALLGAGYTVFGTTRSPDTVKAGHGLEQIKYLPLDLTDEAGIAKLLATLPPVDVLVNNAGSSLMGAVEETSMEKIREMFELSLFGHIRLIKGILPGMRERGGGFIINIGSLAELSPVPCASVYASAKAALHVFSVGLRQEVRQFGVHVVTLAPSFINTSIYQERLYDENSVYAKMVENAGSVRDRNINAGSPPEVIADRILKILKSKNPASFYAAGKNAGLLTLMHRFVPEKLRDAIIRRYFNE